MALAPPFPLSPFLPLLTILLLLTCSLSAQSTLTPGVQINPGHATNKWQVATTATTWRSIIVNNTGASDLWIFVFDSATNKLNNTTFQVAPFKVTAGTTGYFDPPSGPLRFERGLVLHSSTTTPTLTNNAAAGSNALAITVIRNP